MRITLVGHACLLIQAKNTTLLTDPCLFDIHFEELNVYYPNVRIEREKIPDFDVLYLSHRHQDHFDVRTLASLPKNKKVLVPDDKVILHVLKELKFTDVTVVENFEPVKVKDLTLTPTPSMTLDPYPEHGLLIHDGEVRIWNQVDTIVTPDIINHIVKLHGRLDFAHVRFQPLLEQNFAFNKARTLPFEEYNSFLQTVRVLRPKFVVPGSAGERYVEPFAFLNHFVFPATQDQFVRDMSEFCPDVKASCFQPGDIAEVTKEGVSIRPQSSPFVRSTPIDPFVTQFNPLCEFSRIRSLTLDPAKHEEEMRVVRDFIEDHLVARLKKSPMLEAWRHWRMGYLLEVFGRDGVSEAWCIDFTRDPVVERRHPDRIHLYEGIGSSELYRLIRNETNWDFVGGGAQFRTFHNLYRVEVGGFECYPQEKKFPGPLMEAFPIDDAMELEKFMKDVRRYR